MQALQKLCLFNFKKIVFVQSIKECSTLAKAKWDILCAVSLERNPVIAKELNDIERKMNEMLQEIENEQSHKSNFELRLEEDERRQKLLKSGKLTVEELDNVGQQTGHDFLDSSAAELKSFKTAPRVNPKEDNNLKSSQRLLEKYLHLLVKDKVGDKSIWVLPQGRRKDDETLRQTAERILVEKCGENIKARFYGNAPSGFYKYKYPKAVQQDSVGAKIFFYKAQFLGGRVDVKKGSCQDYQWATRSELNVLQPDYCKSVKMFLIDE